jgi:hypothetical protein
MGVSGCLNSRLQSKAGFHAISKDTLHPARVASSISMSRLNLSHLPRTRSDTRDWVMRSFLAACAGLVAANRQVNIGLSCFLWSYMPVVPVVWT